jgi:hypothetical protein
VKPLRPVNNDPIPVCLAHRRSFWSWPDYYQHLRDHHSWGKEAAERATKSRRGTIL